MKIYLGSDDEFTWSFFQVDADGLAHGDKPRWIDSKEVSFENSDRHVLSAMAVIREGERLQRPVVKRKVKKGTRNITSRTCRCDRLLGWAREPEIMASDDRKAKNRMMKVMKEQLDGLVKTAREQVSWEGEVPSRWSYKVTEDVLDVAEDVGCLDYFEPLADQCFFEADLKKIEASLKAGYPEAVDEVMAALRATKTDGHLSMISLAADEQGALFVTLVDPKGHHLKVEASRFVEMVDSHDQPRRLHVFPPRGHRLPVPFAFNDNSEGEIVGKFIPEQMKFDVVCCRVQGQHSNVHDRAWFYVDAEYLLCLWVVLCRLDQDKTKYTKMQSMAEATIAFDPFAAGASL